MFVLSLSGASWLATARPSSILPPRAERFFYYLDATAANCDYKSIWERLADSLILSACRSQEVHKGAFVPGPISSAPS